MFVCPTYKLYQGKPDSIESPFEKRPIYIASKQGRLIVWWRHLANLEKC